MLLIQSRGTPAHLHIVLLCDTALLLLLLLLGLIVVLVAVTGGIVEVGLVLNLNTKGGRTYKIM